MIISAPRMFLEGAFSGPGGVRVEAGRVAEIISGPVAADVVLETGFLAPGLIDLHNNGAFGVDCAAARPGDWDVFVSGLAARGVTSVLPTVITAPMADLHEAAAGVAAAMGRHGAILGLHVEGPFLSHAKAGAHPGNYFRVPDEEAVAELISGMAMREVLRVITLAPELPGALEAIRRFVAAGVVVSLGHTAASAAEMQAGVDAGARMVTHVFNAQSGLGHRAPGAVGVALTDARVFPCLIVDGVHVDPMVLQLAFAACGRAVAVTDSILIAGLELGAEREFGAAPVVLGPQGVGLRADGTIAGAGITLDEGVRRLIAAGVAPEVAFEAATRRPAAALGLEDRGRIAVGARADLVWWGDDYFVGQVWVADEEKSGEEKIEGKHLFFEKKKQKTFVNLARAVGAPTGQGNQSFFASFFEKEEVLASPSPPGTETARFELADLDERDTLGIVSAFLAQEAAAQGALGAVAGELAALADAVAARMQAGGRLFYVGAGTSGRLGLLDAVECGPTFGIEDGVIIPVLAGGTQAFIRAVEGAEDNSVAAVAALRAENFSAGDVLVGIAASGATPFTLAAVRYANEVGALTGAIVNNPGSLLATAASIAVAIASGPEVIAGSTRLSAGSTQKIALNTLSSTVMIRLGKVYGPYMVDMRATNDKLRARAVRMVAAIAGVDENAARLALAQCGQHVKTAVVMLRLDLSADAARNRLQRSKNALRRALKIED